MDGILIYLKYNKTIKTTLYYCLYCNFVTTNDNKFYNHTNDELHQKLIKKSPCIYNDISNHSIVRYFIKNASEYSFDNVNWHKIYKPFLVEYKYI